MAGSAFGETDREEGRITINLEPGIVHYVEWSTELVGIYGNVYAEFDKQLAVVHWVEAKKRLKDTNYIKPLHINE
jgi:hypothetical protein